ncbi:MAG: type I methionyl aminopeptidase [Spirochaetes bacterium]|nr:type I methionyl aminopeptidase [Spirochaetota bacterium]
MNIVQSIRLKTNDDLKRIAEAGKIIAAIFRELEKISLVEMTTHELDAFIESLILKHHARPSFKTVPNYHHATCLSVNDEVVHGIPSKKKKLKEGDIIKIDIGVVKNGYFADACRTFPVGHISERATRLIRIAKEALEIGLDQVRPNRKLGDIGFAIQTFVESHGYSVVRDFTGHGVGFAVHENPNVPHYGKKNTGLILREGLVLAIEPMINEGTEKVIILDDGWTAMTADGKLSAQFEHTVAVTKKGPLILTD